MNVNRALHVDRDTVRSGRVRCGGRMMRTWFLSVGLLAAAVCGVVLQQAAAADEAVLHWVSGDSLTGRLVAADAQTLTWQSPLFAEPLQLDLSLLSRVTFAKTAESAAGDTGPAESVNTLRVTMRNGDVLLGQLVGVDQQAFQLQSRRHGLVSLRREQIRSLRRLDSPGLVFQGPHGLRGWRHPLFTQWAEPPGWTEVSEGRLSTAKSEAVMFRPTEFPQRCEIELVLSSSSLPSFVLALGSNADKSLRLETWDQEIVAMSHDDFVRVDTLAESQRQVHLFLFVDFETQRMTVFTEAGRQLAELQGRAGDAGTPGILLRNGERDLTLDYISIAHWDGTPFQGVQSDRSRVHTVDGRVHYGQIVSVSDDGQSVRVSDGSQTADIRLEDLRGLIVTDQDAPAVSTDQVCVKFADGETLSGTLRGLSSEQRLTLQTVHCEAPIATVLEGVQQLQLQSSAQAAAAADASTTAAVDRLYFREGTLQGTLMLDDNSVAPVRWRPAGGRNASALTASGAARFVRGLEAARVPVDLQTWPDVVYLTNNDVLPCRLLGCRGDAVQLTMPFCDVQEIPAAEVRAVELRQPQTPGRTGFGDRGWRRIVGNPLHEPERLVFRASEAMGHTSLLSGDVLQFRLSWGSRVAATLTFHLYTQLPSSVPTGTPISFVCRGDTLSVHDGTTAEPALFARGAAPPATVDFSTPHRSASVTVFRQADRIRVSVDGQLAGTFVLPKSASDSRGILIRANIININRELGRARDGGNARAEAAEDVDKTIEVSEFEIRDLVGGSIRQFIDEAARDVALTVPRFRRESPPAHVLLAPNGDLLRGTLREISDKGLVFESRLEQLQLPRERVAAIIWLKPAPAAESVAAEITAESRASGTPAAAAPPAVDTPAAQPGAEPSADNPDPRSIQIVLPQGILLTMVPERIQDGQLIGRSSRLGACRVPAAGIAELSVGQWESGRHAAAYTQWIPKHAVEPVWDVPEESESAPALQMVGEVAPGIQLPTLDAALFRLPDHRDKIIVLDFWATWCGPCVKTLPEYAAVCEQFDPAQVRFVAVNLEETPQAVRAFLKEHQLSPLVLMDRTGIVGAEFNVSGIPHTVIIGRDNVIEHVRIGYRKDGAAELQQTLQQILEGTWQRPQRPDNVKPQPSN